MNDLKKALVYGFLIWFIPFIASFLVFPLKASNAAFFQSIMSVVLVISVVYFTYQYFKFHRRDFESEGKQIAVLWFAISLAIDMIVFLPAASPMHMSAGAYFTEIGLGYLVIPAIVIGMSYLLQRNH